MVFITGPLTGGRWTLGVCERVVGVRGVCERVRTRGPFRAVLGLSERTCPLCGAPARPIGFLPSHRASQ